MLGTLVTHIDAANVTAIAVDGTSATVLLADQTGDPITPGIMYNDARAITQAQKISKVCGFPCGAQGPASSLAKLMWLHENEQDRTATYLLSQSDWIAGKLCNQWGITDYNNALKLGYDVIRLDWPQWIQSLPIRQALLPQVGTPGDVLGKISPVIAKTFGFNPDTTIKLGTTDSVAAFMASGANNTGQAVTSLGSTLVLKLLSNQPVFADEFGIYSHRLGDHWLVGGASNSGGAVLLQHFSEAEMNELSPAIRPEQPLGLNYYPLPAVGERFPVNDPELEPRMQPVPDSRREYFQALLEGIAEIERQGYQRLHDSGAPFVSEVFSSGGGAINKAWADIRQRLLRVPVRQAPSSQAAFGSARLALGAYNE